MTNPVFCTATKPETTRCTERGSLIAKGGCYALRCDDGTELWLEMDPIPLHLVDRSVHVEGARYPSNLIAVEAIGPA